MNQSITEYLVWIIFVGLTIISLYLLLKAIFRSVQQKVLPKFDVHAQITRKSSKKIRLKDSKGHIILHLIRVEFENGLQKEFSVSGDTHSKFNVGDRAEFIFQGDLFKKIVRKL